MGTTSTATRWDGRHDAHRRQGDDAHEQEREVLLDRLRRNEARFRTLLQHASELTLVWSAEGAITYASPPTIRFARGSDPATDRESVQAAVLIHPDDRRRVQQATLDLMERPGGTTRLVARIRRHDGVYRKLEVTITNLLDDPSIAGVVANARDVTDEVEAVEALRRNEERWASLVRNSSDIICVIDELGTMTYASPAAERLLGFAPDELIGMNAFDLVHEEDVETAAVELAEILERPGGTSRLELRCRHADGSWRVLEIAATNLLDDPAVGGIVMNNRDVTDRAAAEEAQRQSEEWFRRLVQYGYDMIAVVDEDFTVRFMSPSIENVLGYDPADLVGRGKVKFVHEDDQPAVAKQLARVMANPSNHTPIEFRARHADGSWRWLELVFTNRLDDPVVHGVVGNFRDVTERKQAEEDLAHQALHDSLTGLPNRYLLEDRLTVALARAARDATRVGVLFLDVDRFKLVNDTRGHAAGDTLLASIAKRLSEATRASDTVARFGGDEFVVVYEGVTNIAELVERGRALCRALEVPFEVDSTDVYASVSVGAAMSLPSTSSDSLLRDADAAMYHAKEQGGACVEAVDDAIRERAFVRFETEHALRAALERRQFALVYQPVIALASGRITGVEALIRWHHPERGVVPPLDFIPLAEDTGLIIPIGAWVIEQACQQLAAWAENPAKQHLTVAVNVSAAQLRGGTLPGRVSETIERFGIDPAKLTLEITESFLAEDSAACIQTLRALKDLGIRLAVDDFGTRYSSLSYLDRMPLDALKIDRTFVARLGDDPRDAAILSAIMAMARALDLSVIAEGVETASQAAHLRTLGCGLAQGFYFARPIPPTELRACMAQEPFSVPAPAKLEPLHQLTARP